jgi:hypothetical protein
MIAGHFGFASAVKAREREIPLWALMLACQWLDVIFVPLLLMGVERFENVPGTAGGYGKAIIYADYTHSFVGALALSLLFGVAAFVRWGRKSGAVLAAVVFSHWILDLVVHRADLPILPGNAGDLPRLGFGLWQLPALSALVELCLVLGGGYAYWRAACKVVNAAGQRAAKAHTAGAVVVASGLLTLALNVAGF